MCLTARPEDVLYASVAYTRDEMQAFDHIIALHSSGSLQLDPAHDLNTKSILSLPVELMLDIRHHLHRSLTERTRTEAAGALAAYEDALVHGLCADCFWWNFDMHGADVWDWVKSGYREACHCGGRRPRCRG